MLATKISKAQTLLALSAMGDIEGDTSPSAQISISDRPSVETLSLVSLFPDPSAGPDAEWANDVKDGLGPARGILFGLALSIPIWALIGLAVYGLIHLIRG